MKHARKALAMLFLFVTPLLLSGVFAPAINEEAKATLHATPTGVSIPSYETITPLMAFNDSDLSNYASALSWEGNGMPDDPYIIEGYNITSDMESILIMDVSLAFEIRGCYLSSVSGDAGMGIYIYNATQAAVIDTIFQDKSFAMMAHNVSVLVVQNCTFTDVQTNLHLLECPGALVDDCSFYDSVSEGIYLFQSNDTVISNNLIRNLTAGNGIYFQQSHRVTITDNELSDCPGGGVWALESPYCIIENNI